MSNEPFITRAYLSLSSAPKGKSGEQTISLVRIRNYEIRMVQPSQTVPADGALFWLELFNLTSKLTIDSCRCRDIEEAVAVYAHLLAQVSATDRI